jgi:hypothetical protein
MVDYSIEENASNPARKVKSDLSHRLSRDGSYNKKKRFIDDQKLSDNEVDERKGGDEEQFKIPKKDREIVKEIRSVSN